MQAPNTSELSTRLPHDMTRERQLEIILLRYKTRLYRFLACAPTDDDREPGAWGEIMIEHDTVNAIMALFSDR